MIARRLLLWLLLLLVLVLRQSSDVLSHTQLRNVNKHTHITDYTAVVRH